MATKASEISELIKQQIKNFEHEAKSSDVGTVVSVTDGYHQNTWIKRRPVRRDDRVSWRYIWLGP